MNILSVSLDRKVFEEGSAVRSRLLEYGRLADELRIIVFAKRSAGVSAQSFPPNIFLYPTNARTRFGYIPAALRQVVTLKKQGVHVDVVTAQDPFETGLTAFLIARILGAKLHLQIHTDFLSPHFARESFINRARVVLAKFLLPRAHAVRVVSARIKQSIEGLVRREVMVTVLPILVDVERLQNTPVVRDIKKEYPQFSTHFLMASRLSVEKNIPLAFEAFCEVLEKYPRAGLVVVGSGPEEPWIQSLVQAHNLSRNVVLLPWKDDVVSYMKTADAFLLTSNYEGYGMTIVEALVVGRPVISTDVGCAREVIQGGVNGFVVPVGDASALTDVLLKVAAHEIKFKQKPPALLTKAEYLALYKKSWEDALR